MLLRSRIFEFRMQCLSEIILLGLLDVSYIDLLQVQPSSCLADCSKPTLPSNIYVLSPSYSSYKSGYAYEIVCTPGFSPSSVVYLECNSSGSWSGKYPDCMKTDNAVRWWILLIIVVTLIILIPCTVPRVYFYYFDGPQIVRMDRLHRRRLLQSKVEGTELTPMSKPQENQGVTVQWRRSVGVQGDLYADGMGDGFPKDDTPNHFHQ